RLGASVLLIKALGGGWSADRLPTDREVTRLLGRGMARRLDETHPNLTLADQNRQERGRRRLGESKTPSDLGGCGKPDLLDTGQQLVLDSAHQSVIPRPPSLVADQILLPVRCDTDRHRPAT